MRVLLYDAQSDRYFQSPQGWTEDPNLALDLGGTVQAVSVAYQQKLQSAEIILAFDDAHLNNMRLPLNLSGELASNWQFPSVATSTDVEKPAA
jgi:hypothetical protein